MGHRFSVHDVHIYFLWQSEKLNLMCFQIFSQLCVICTFVALANSIFTFININQNNFLFICSFVANESVISFLIKAKWLRALEKLKPWIVVVLKSKSSTLVSNRALNHIFIMYLKEICLLINMNLPTLYLDISIHLSKSFLSFSIHFLLSHNNVKLHWRIRQTSFLQQLLSTKQFHCRVCFVIVVSYHLY